MANGNINLLYARSEGNTARTSTKITITLDQPIPTNTGQGGCSSIFSGVDASDGNRGPGAACSFIFPNEILVQGAFEDMFVNTIVDTSNGVSGTITIDPPLPVNIRMSLIYGAPLCFVPAGTTSAHFSFDEPAQAPMVMPVGAAAVRQHVGG